MVVFREHTVPAEERTKFVLHVQANMDQGDVIIRPSSKGEDHLTVSWKVTHATSPTTFLFSGQSNNRYGKKKRFLCPILQATIYMEDQFG